MERLRQKNIFLLTDNVQEKIRNYIQNTQGTFWSNLTKYYCGYGICALERILPADIPVIILGGELSKKELMLLARQKGKCCVIALESAFEWINKENFEPDFLLQLPNSKYECLSWKEEIRIIPMITCTSSDKKIMQEHSGMKFIYGMENEFENSIWQHAAGASQKKYQYSHKVLFDQMDGQISLITQIAQYMGATRIIIAGSDFRNCKIRAKDSAELLHAIIKSDNTGDEPFENLLEKSCLKQFRLKNILSELFPFFDENGKKQFYNEYQNIPQISRKILEIIKKMRGLYNELYQTALQEPIPMDRINLIIDMLNQNTDVLEKNEFSKYLLGLLEDEHLHIKEDEWKHLVCPNEITEIAAEGMCTFEKLYLICEEVEVIVEKVIDENFIQPCIKINKMEHVPSVLIVYGQSAYDVLPGFAIGLKDGFQKLGYHTYLWDVEKNNYSLKNGYIHYQNTVGFDYIMLMNGVYIDAWFMDEVLSHSRYIFDYPRTQVMALFVDHPIYMIPRLKYANKFVQVILPDKKWTEYIWNNMKEIEKTCFLPLGGMIQTKSVSFSKKRNMVVFFGGCRDLQKIESHINSNMYSTFAWRVINYLKKNIALTVEEAVYIIARENECIYSATNLMLHSDMMQTIDTYMRQYFRQRVISIIADAGLPMELYGLQNNTNFNNYSNVKVKNAVSMDEMLKICRETRFVLNVNPWTKYGTQERVFNTMLGNSVCITDENEYLAKECQDRENILFYQLDKIEKLPNMIKYYMEHEDEAAQIAQNGYLLAKEKHTWTKRTEQLVDLLDMPKNF